MTFARRLTVVLVSVLLLCSARGAAAERVITLFALSSRDFERHLAAEERVRAELSAAGFTVKDRHAQARSRASLLDELRSVSTWGSVAVLLENERGVGYVWLEGQPDVRVTWAEGDAAAADTLALSVVELVNARALAIDVPEARDPRAPDIAVSDNVIRAAEPAARVAPRRWYVSADFGPVASPGMQRWGWLLGAAVLFAPSGTLALELGAHGMLVEATSNTDAGTASLRTWDVRGYALWRAIRTLAVEWDLGAGLGPLLARAHSRPRADAAATEDTTTTLVIAARSRLVWWLQPPLGLLVVAEPAIIAPPLELFEGTRALAVLGRPWVSVGLGVVLAI